MPSGAAGIVPAVSEYTGAQVEYSYHLGRATLVATVTVVPTVHAVELALT